MKNRESLVKSRESRVASPPMNGLAQVSAALVLWYEGRSV
jgi:hypothetical protein